MPDKASADESGPCENQILFQPLERYKGETSQHGPNFMPIAICFNR